VRRRTKPVTDAPSDLLGWSRYYFPHRFTIEPSLFHRELAADLDRIVKTRGEKICRIAPRGSAKSTLSTLADALKNALEGTEMYTIIISDVQTNSNKFLKDIKDEIETNEKLKRDYPESCGIGPVWQQEAIELPNGARIESLGKGGKIRGRRHRQYRPTRIILDDPQSLEDAYSEVQMEKDVHWLMSDVMSVGQPDTNFVVLGTALADLCIVCQLERTPGWDFRRYQQLLSEPSNMGIWHQWKELLWKNDDPDRDAKAQKYYLDHQPEMDAGSKVLWPERFPLYEVMRKRYSEGERAFQCEQQGVPMPPGDSEWPIDYFDYDGFWFDEWPESLDLRVLSLDPSKGKESKQGDYQAFIDLGRDATKTLYCEAWLEKFDIKVMCDFLVELYRKRNPDIIALEENGFQELIRIPLEQSCTKYAVTPNIQPIVNTVAKQVRIRRLTPYLAQKQIKFRRTPGTMMLVDQLKKYRVPPIGHDDGCDSLEQGLRVMIDLFNARYYSPYR
jgi:hypothetical protein